MQWNNTKEKSLESIDQSVYKVVYLKTSSDGLGEMSRKVKQSMKLKLNFDSDIALATCLTIHHYKCIC